MASRRANLTVFDAVLHPRPHLGVHPAHGASAGTIEANAFGKGRVVLRVFRAVLGVHGGAAESGQLEQLRKAQDARRLVRFGVHGVAFFEVKASMVPVPVGDGKGSKMRERASTAPENPRQPWLCSFNGSLQKKFCRGCFL